MRAELTSWLYEAALAAYVLLVVAAVACADDPVAPTQPVKATLIELHDGDTAHVTINLPFAVDLPNRTVRAYGYDAWEITKTRQTVNVTDAEIVKGKTARDALLSLIQSGELWLEDTGAHDPYGRTSALLWVKADGKWVYVPKFMEKGGHLRTPREP